MTADRMVAGMTIRKLASRFWSSVSQASGKPPPLR
jgi:hypothetical protein